MLEGAVGAERVGNAGIRRERVGGAVLRPGHALGALPVGWIARLVVRHRPEDGQEPRNDGLPAREERRPRALDPHFEVRVGRGTDDQVFQALRFGRVSGQPF